MNPPNPPTNQSVSQPDGFVFITTTDCCSNCGAKLSNAETARLNWQQRANELSIELDAWKAAFGTSQLTHAEARLNAAEARCAKMQDLLHLIFDGYEDDPDKANGHVVGEVCYAELRKAKYILESLKSQK